MQCIHCQTPVSDQARYCPICGSLQSDAEGQARVSASMDASAFRHMETLLKEDTASEYVIERLLGRGGMAVVYLATEIRLGRKVAIKVLPPELTFGHGVIRFTREAKTVAALDHPGIIPLYRISSGDKIFWYAMKYLEGRSLDELLKEKPRFSVKETGDLLLQVADALDYAHEHQVVHRDIKPGNIMLDGRGRVVVTDFGIAKALTGGTLTAVGSVIGTPYFMSPEQGTGKTVTGASDQYSVAVLAYRMLTGQVPFEGDSAVDIVYKHCTLPPPPLEIMVTGVPAHVAQAILRGMEKSPENRFPTVRDFVLALRGGDDSTPSMGFLNTGPASSAATVPLPAAAAQSGSISYRPTPVTRRPAAAIGGGMPNARKLAVAGVLASVIVGVWLWTSRSPGARSNKALAPTPPDSSTLQVPAAGRSESAGPALPTVIPESTATATVVSPSPAAPSVKTPPQTAAPTTGRVALTGLPGGARVQSDGHEESGRPLVLPPGRHDIRVDAPGYGTFAATVDVVAGQTARIRYAGRPIAAAPPTPAPGPAATSSTARGVLQIRINPWANVSVDGIDKGPKSALIDSVLSGTHSIRLSRDGFATIDTVVRVAAGATQRVSFQLSPRSP